MSVLRIVQAVAVLHARGFESLRIRPGMSPSGMYWRITINDSVSYTTGNHNNFAGMDATAATLDEVADHLLTLLPGLEHSSDPACTG